MGELTRNFNWSETRIGSPENWSRSLKTTLGILLHSAFPMFLFWGEDLICFYNDAYRPSLGNYGKHPILGKKAEEAWPEIWDSISPMIEQVLTTGNAVKHDDLLLPIFRNGKMENVYWSFSYSAVFGDQGDIEGVCVICIETTDSVHAVNALEREKEKFTLLIEQAPVATCLLTGPELKIEIANEQILKHWGKGNEVVGKRLLDVLPELAGQPFPEILAGVYAKGDSYVGQEVEAHLVVDGVPGTFFFNFTYRAVKDKDGTIFGVLCMSVNVTEQVLLARALKKSRMEMQAYFEQAPVAIATIDRKDLTFRLVNPFYAELVGRKPQELENKPLLEALPEIAGQGFVELLHQVMDSGIPYLNEETEVMLVRGDKLEQVFVKLAYHPHRNAADEITGVLVVATDVTQLIHARKQLAESKDRLQFAIDAAELGTWDLNPGTMKFSGNERLKEWFGLAPEEEIDLASATNVIVDPDRDRVIAAINGSMQPQSGGKYEISYTIEHPQTAKRRIVKAKGKALFNDAGEAVHFGGILQDITAEAIMRAQLEVEIAGQVEARRKLELQEKELRDLITAAPIGICIVSGDPVRAEEVNDRFLQISGKPREDFMAKPYWEVLPEIAPLFESVLENVFLTGEKFSSDEYKMTLIRNGEEETIYATFVYIPVADHTGKVTKVIIVSIEVTHQAEYRNLVEKEVQERTEELKKSNYNLQRSNAELEQFAYITSHDLQEPVRKITTFANFLRDHLTEKDSTTEKFLGKIFDSTTRMTNLISDVLAFSQLDSADLKITPVNLNVILQAAREELELKIDQSGTHLEVAELPVVNANATQMIQLFGNLISNSIKFAQRDVSPVVRISCKIAAAEKVARHPQLNPHAAYYHISYSDNGIGFTQEQSDRIFKMFHRLHGKNEYAGTGMGLSICRKIVQAHDGHIAAAPGENGGAVFNILLPA